jgi:hypothetical protein
MVVIAAARRRGSKSGASALCAAATRNATIAASWRLRPSASDRRKVEGRKRRGWRKKPEGGRMSLRAISTALAEQGHVNERGEPFNPKSVAVMMAAR